MRCQRYARAKHADRRDDAVAQVAHVGVAVAPAGGRVDAVHVVGQEVARRQALYERASGVADHRRDDVAFTHGVGAGAAGGFLPQAAECRADHQPAAVQQADLVVELAVQDHPAEQLKLLLLRQPRLQLDVPSLGVGLLLRHLRRCL